MEIIELWNETLPKSDGSKRMIYFFPKLMLYIVISNYFGSHSTLIFKSITTVMSYLCRSGYFNIPKINLGDTIDELLFTQQYIKIVERTVKHVSIKKDEYYEAIIHNVINSTVDAED